MLSLAKRAEEYGINLYSCHTNLDCCDGGLNDFVAKLIGMRDIKNIDGCARCGEVDEIFLKDFAEAVSQRLNDSCVKYVGSDKRMIKKLRFAREPAREMKNLSCGQVTTASIA